MKRMIATGVAVVVLGAVVAAGIKSYSSGRNASTVAGQSSVVAGGQIQPQGEVVRLLTGSAKFGFLKDPEMEALLAKEGLRVELVKSGAFSEDALQVGKLDAAWPAGANAANDWALAMKGASTYPVFATPLALASWKQLVPVFEANGLAKTKGSHADFHLDKALALMSKGTRWNQLKSNDVFDVNKSLLVNTPDVRKSNTGLLYIASLAWIKNGSEVPQDRAMAEKLADELSPLITRQGFQEGTLAGPFEDYGAQGIGKAPLVLVYESQFVEAKLAGKLRDNHMLMYPQPGLVLKHVLVARTPAGKKLGEVLSNNPKAQAIAARYGFRTNDPRVFEETVKKAGLDAPELINLADVPSTAVLDAMNRVIVKKLEGN